MSNTCYAVLPAMSGWRIVSEKSGLGRYETRAAALEAAVEFGRLDVAGGGSVELLLADACGALHAVRLTASQLISEADASAGRIA